jgi:energy-coupling factor transporter ATP-binding protein EcfA2
VLDEAAAAVGPHSGVAGTTDAGGPEVVIRVRDLRFRYPGAARDALAGINLDVARGEFLGITGPSGAGKSTLCLCLKGLVPAGDFSGTVSVAGHAIGTQSPYIEGSALVFQNPETQIIGLTVAEDLAFGPENLQRDPAWIRNAIPGYLDTVRLKGYEDADTYRLSGGQKQRLAIADALIMEPEILILDEPTSELDPIGKDEVFEVLERLRKERSITIIMVEHAAEQLAEMADRIVLMQDGLVVDQGPPDELYRNPLLFQRPDAERSPQISQVLFQLVQAGLLSEQEFTARESTGVERLRALLLNTAEVQHA